MLTQDIRWLDGQDHSGKFVLEMIYTNDGRSYIKGDKNSIDGYYELFASCPEVAEMVIYNTQGLEVVRKVCLTNVL
jgi:hypothetical protein